VKFDEKMVTCVLKPDAEREIEMNEEELRCTPAMAASVTDRLWEVSDLVVLLEADERGLERAA
jgi:hypothetical protein